MRVGTYTYIETHENIKERCHREARSNNKMYERIGCLSLFSEIIPHSGIVNTYRDTQQTDRYTNRREEAESPLRERNCSCRCWTWIHIILSFLFHFDSQQNMRRTRNERKEKKREKELHTKRTRTGLSARGKGGQNIY